jgi:hypothetical protein
MPVSLTARVGSLILTDLFKRNLLQDHRVVMCQLVYGGEQLPKQFLRLGVLLNKFAEVENNCLSEQLPFRTPTKNTESRTRFAANRPLRYPRILSVRTSRRRNLVRVESLLVNFVGVPDCSRLFFSFP